MWQQESVEATYVAIMPTQLMFFPRWEKSCLLILCCWFNPAGGSAPHVCSLPPFPVGFGRGSKNKSRTRGLR